MKKYYLAFAVLAIVACGNPKSTHTDDHNHAEGETHTGENHSHAEGETHDHTETMAQDEGHTDEIVFTLKQAAMGPFALEKVTKQPFAPVIKVSGTVISSPTDYRALVAPADGLVVMDKNVSEGAFVPAGTHILHISTKNLQDGELYARAKAEYDYALAQWERAERLIKDRIITRTEYEQAKKEYTTARLNFKSLGDTDAHGIGVSAPFSGYVRSIDATPGAFVQKGSQLLSLVKSNRSRLRADVPQKYYNLLPSVTSAVFSTDNSAVYDTDSLKGNIVSYSRSVMPSGLLTMTVEYDGVSDVPEGAFVNINLRLNDKREAISVPLSAVTEEQGSYFVYVQLDEEGYLKRPVTLGQDDGLRVEILSGLHEGETVVAQGAYRVKLAGASGAIPHGHEH